jgi:hypothetical protein
LEGKLKALILLFGVFVGFGLGLGYAEHRCAKESKVTLIEPIKVRAAAPTAQMETPEDHESGRVVLGTNGGVFELHDHPEWKPYPDCFVTDESEPAGVRIVSINMNIGQVGIKGKAGDTIAIVCKKHLGQISIQEEKP